MERIELSLKTIYKMLMSNDYPVYSNSVIPEKMRRGQTLLRFWQTVISEEFCTGPCGRVIWRKDGKRNRYLSALCNRSNDYRMMNGYAAEIAASCTTDMLRKQISRFCEFLSLREYRYEILLRRVVELVRILEKEDRAIASDVLEHIQACAVPDLLPPDAEMEGRLFQAGYLLTIMTVFACSGAFMDEAQPPLMLDEKHSMESLWQDRKIASDAGNTLEYLTVPCGILQDRRLPRHRFFGREEALFDIRELAAGQGKCLISGIGGIGKTELLRQLLHLCEEERFADKLAVVPYGGGLAESFVRTFLGRRHMETEVQFRSILEGLRRDAAAGNRVLVLIDDLNKGLDEDPDLKELAGLPCGVLITSRRTELDGFETYYLKAPSITTGALIFRDNYGKLLTREDRDVLSQMLRSESVCHPLTLSLMARVAGSRDWSVSELMRQLESQGMDLRWVEGNRLLRTSSIYNRLYSMMEVSDGCRQVAELFTLLPSDSYSEAFLTSVFPALMGNNPMQKLQMLSSGGWLEKLSDGYSMHPLIAECLRRRVITEERQSAVLECLRRQLPLIRPVRYEMELPPEERVRIGRILLHTVNFISGSISGGLMMDLLNSLSLQSFTREAALSSYAQLNGWRKRCSQWNDLLQVTYGTVAAGWSLLPPEECEAVYNAQKARLTVPRQLFVDFCVTAGQSLIYQRRDALAWQMLSEGLCEEATPGQKGMAYYHLAGHCHVLGKPEEALEWSEQGAAYVREHPQCGVLMKANILHMLCNMHIQYRQKEKAEAALRELEPLFEGIERPDIKAQYFDLLGIYEMTFGDPDQAIRHMREGQRLYVECFGEDRNYYQQTNMIGNTLIRLNRLEEAVEAYETCIAYAGRTGDRRLLQSASNNISVALLKGNRPRAALAHLETAVAEGEKIGGLMYGESLRNTALAWGQLEDEEKELSYYEKAWPLLLEAYGKEHPRADAAWKRMEELKNRK